MNIKRIKLMFFLFAAVFFGVSLSGLIYGLSNDYVLTPIVSAFFMIVMPIAVYLDWKKLSIKYGFKSKKDSN